MLIETYAERFFHLPKKLLESIWVASKNSFMNIGRLTCAVDWVELQLNREID